MKIVSLPIPGAAIAYSHPVEDARGRLTRIFCQNELADLTQGRPVQQINISLTRSSGTVRGLHFQYPPGAEDKAIRCLRGCVYDVLVDLRPRSPSFLKWHGVELSARENNMVYIPRGVAHGFQSLEPDT